MTPQADCRTFHHHRRYNKFDHKTFQVIERSSFLLFKLFNEKQYTPAYFTYKNKQDINFLQNKVVKTNMYLYLSIL